MKLAGIYGKEDRNMRWYWMGYGLAGMDVNKDGFTDALVSATGPNTVYTYFGGSGIFDTTADLEFRGGGEMVTGDFDGDGLKDLAVRRVNSIEAQKMELSYDSFYVYMGVKDSLFAIETFPQFVIPCPVDTTDPDDCRIGDILLSGDLDGDGEDELIVAGRSFRIRERTGVSLGGAFVWNFPHGDVADTLSSILLSGANSGILRSIACGDINGDGIADMQIALQERYVGPQISMVKICVSFGKPGLHPNLSKPDQVFSNDVMGYTRDTYVNNFSSFYTTLLDVNRDGRADLLWVPCKDSLWIMYGTSDGLSGKVDKIIVNPDTTRWWSFRLNHHIIGDHNSDGHDDYILEMGVEEGNWPALVVYAGNTYGLTNQPMSVCVGGGKYYGRYVINLGDINGNGSDDHIFGDPVEPGEPFFQDGWCTVADGAFWIKTDIDSELVTADPPPAPFSVEIYPSPSTGDITLLLKDEAPGEYYLKMYTLDGKVIFTRSYQLVNSDNVIVLLAGDYAAHISPGVHFIELRSTAGSVTRKVVLTGK